MKRMISLTMACVAVMALAGCKTQQKATVVTPQQAGNVEIQLPCASYDNDSEEYFSGMGVAENMNMQNARLAALNSAKTMLMNKLAGAVRGLTTAYAVNASGNARTEDVRRLDEQEFIQVIERELNDVEQTCEKMYQTPQGAYQSHIAIRISKKEMVKKMVDRVSEDEQLRTRYDREQFRKFANEYMQGYKNQ